MPMVNKRRLSQKDMLLKMMREGRTVTRLICMNYGIQNLTARIADLREDGHDVVCNEKTDAMGRRYGEFSLQDDVVPANAAWRTPGATAGGVATL